MAGVFPVEGFGFPSNYNGAFVTGAALSAMQAIAATNAHALGLSVMLRPMLTGLDGSSAGQLTPSDPAAFFASYKTEILDLAHVAAQSGADSLSIGSELGHLSGSQYRSDWVDLIDSVRAIYHGPITY